MTASDQVLVFGEDENDTSAIVVLVRGIRPDLGTRTKLEPLRKPLTLIKDIDAARLAARARKVVATTKAANVRLPVRACIFHEDTDAVEPSSAALASQIIRAYSGCRGAVLPAVAAWEVEAWWYLFPDAVAATHSSWRAPTQHVGRDTGMIRDPKKTLRRDVRPTGQRVPPSFRTYKESDCTAIARAIVDGGHLPNPKGTSTSWTAFVTAVRAM